MFCEHVDKMPVMEKQCNDRAPMILLTLSNKLWNYDLQFSQVSEKVSGIERLTRLILQTDP
jgi:hypothetical protein